jgi:hypothetical protein
VACCLSWAPMVVAAASWEGMGWLGRVTLRWGQARGSTEMASIHWGLASALVVEGKGEGEGSGRATASGSSSPSSPTEKRQEEKISKIS